MDPETLDVEPEALAPLVIVPPIANRFLFVDIAALRAKQLRRGALPRLDRVPEPEPSPDAPHKEAPHKPERVAMEEVRRGLVQYHLPPSAAAAVEPEA